MLNTYVIVCLKTFEVYATNDEEIAEQIASTGEYAVVEVDDGKARVVCGDRFTYYPPKDAKEIITGAKTP